MTFLQIVVFFGIVLCFVVLLLLPTLAAFILAKDAEEELQKAATKTTTSTSSKWGNLTITTGHARSLTPEDHTSIQESLKNILSNFATKAPRVLYITLHKDWSSYFIYRQRWFGLPDQVFSVHFWPKEIHAYVDKEETNFVEQVYAELETLGKILGREVEVIVE
jgi:hypothetical protein